MRDLNTPLFGLKAEIQRMNIHYTTLKARWCRRNAYFMTLRTLDCHPNSPTYFRDLHHYKIYHNTSTLVCSAFLGIPFKTFSLSLSNGATAQGGPRPRSRVSSILSGLGQLFSSFYTLALLHLPLFHLPNAAWVSLWGAFLLAR